MDRRNQSAYYPALRQVRRFIPGAKISSGLLVLTSAALASVYGVKPFIEVRQTTRALISLIWFWNVIVFAICGGMILWAWLVDRYGDRPEENGH
jgi:hypothetical protein